VAERCGLCVATLTVVADAGDDADGVGDSERFAALSPWQRAMFRRVLSNDVTVYGHY